MRIYLKWNLCFIFAILISKCTSKDVSAINGLNRDPPFSQLLSNDEFQIHIYPDEKYPMPTAFSTNVEISNSLKYDGPDDNEFIQGKSIIFNKIKRRVSRYFLHGAMEDFHTKVETITKETKVEFTAEEKEALSNVKCEKCDEDQLRNQLDVYLTILEKYADLHNNTILRHHLLAEFDRATDYIDKHLKIFWEELEEMRNPNGFAALQGYHKKKEKTPGMMTLLYEWYDDIKAKKDINCEEVTQKLIDHLKRAKRYWLIKITASE